LQHKSDTTAKNAFHAANLLPPPTEKINRAEAFKLLKNEFEHQGLIRQALSILGDKQQVDPNVSYYKFIIHCCVGLPQGSTSYLQDDESTREKFVKQEI
jgi:hypothetical protein